MKMMNKKAQANDTGILLSITVFQSFVIISLGFLNVTPKTVSTDVSLFSFGNVITSISYLGWGNLLLFAPLILIVTYIIARLIRGGG